MKTLKAALAVVAALAATLAGLDLTGIIAVMPPEVAKVLVVVPSAAAVIVHAVAAFNKALDNKDGSDKVQCNPLMLVVALALVFASMSCTVALDPATGRLGIATDPKAVSLVIDRLNERLNEKLAEKVPPVAVPVTPAK